MNQRDRILIREALHHLTILQDHLTNEDLGLLVVQDAVCLRLSAAIEALNRLDVQQRDGLFGATWAEMWATRNRIAHAYNLIDAEIIAATIEQDVPGLIATLTDALDRDQPGSGADSSTSKVR